MMFAFGVWDTLLYTSFQFHPFNSRFHNFAFLNIWMIVYCKNVAILLYIHQLTDIQSVSISWLIMNGWTGIFVERHSFLRSQEWYIWVMWQIYFFFQEALQWVPWWLHQFTLPSAVNVCPLSPHPCQHLSFSFSS